DDPTPKPPPPPPKVDLEPTKPAPPPPASTGAEVYARTLQSIGWVNVPRQFPLMSTGTGALVDVERRLFLTAYHVIEGATEARVFFPRFDAEGQPISVRDHYLSREKPIIGDVIVADAKRDLAVLRLRSSPPQTLALSVAAKSIGVAHKVFTVGNPGASSVLWVYTEGSVRQIAFKKFRMDNKQDVEAWIVEAQFPINQGDSGGPVVNDRNELVGVNCSLTSKAQLMSNCVDVREIHAVLEQARRAPPPLNKLPLP
ncbi:MAG: serine protease, partial [Planctomycetota bacterium]